MENKSSTAPCVNKDTTTTEKKLSEAMEILMEGYGVRLHRMEEKMDLLISLIRPRKRACLCLWMNHSLMRNLSRLYLIKRSSSTLLIMLVMVLVFLSVVVFPVVVVAVKAFVASVEVLAAAEEERYLIFF
ncbi:hypothetical protein CARUB_v10012398mg [Capsella rubella]|uniref:Transmembrane protein n=1 Tax=Capsella rubella TaxID=81985 RepID=R0IQ62_9BRAS|nr:hypothetical protein CARUB_v10012398mg [Capsella rubella]